MLCFLLKWGGLKLSVCLCGRAAFDGLAVCRQCRAVVILNRSWLESTLRLHHLLIITKGQLFVYLFFDARKPEINHLHLLWSLIYFNLVYLP